jgi:integrase
MMPRQKKENQEKPPRRARGEGTVFQREDGRYVARVPLGGGKRKEEYYDTKQEAERAKRRMLNERDKGTLATERDQTLEEYIKYWLEVHRVTLRKSTYAMYYTYLKSHIVPALGHVYLRKLNVEMFQTLYLGWGNNEELSPNTIRLIHGIINKALKDAVRWKKLSSNPAQEVTLPKPGKTKNVYALSEEDVKRLLECAQEMRLSLLFRMALLLGMRIGELLAFQWSDIDFEKKTLLIQRKVYYLQDPATGKYEFYVGDPKTEAGERLIYLPGDIVEMLRAHREEQERMRVAASRWKDLDLVFCSHFGNYFFPGFIRVCFDELLERAGLKHMKFHGLRHNASLILRECRN